MKPRRSPVIEHLLSDARSLARPWVRVARGRGKALANQAARHLGLVPAFREPLWEQWRAVAARSKEELARLPPAGEPRVLFATGWGLSDAMLTIESILAMALRMRGASPMVMLCDKVLPACEFNPWGNGSLPSPFMPEASHRGRLEKCRICTENIADPYRHLPVPLVRFSDEDVDAVRREAIRFVDQLDFDRYAEAVFHDVAVGEHARSSVMRSQLRGTMIDNAETRALFRRYLVAACMVVGTGERLFARLRPQRVVAVHGVYVTQGTLCELARRERIPVAVYGTPYRRNTIWISQHDTYHRTLITEPTSRWESLELTAERKRQVFDYLGDKRLGGKDYAAYHTDAENDPAVMRRELGLSPARPVVALYTNVLWDAQLYYRHNAFGGMLEWLFETIRYFSSRPGLDLVIRIHPAESKAAAPTNQPLLPEITRAFPTLPPNVKLVPSESKLSSYTLAEIACAALIYGARMGVEIAAMGTPLIVAGESFNRNKGFSYDVESREAYFSLLDRVESLPRNSAVMVERALKYAYHLYFRLMMDFPLFSIDDVRHMSGARLSFERLQSLSPGKVPALDVACRGILDGHSPFLVE